MRPPGNQRSRRRRRDNSGTAREVGVADARRADDPDEACPPVARPGVEQVLGDPQLVIPPTNGARGPLASGDWTCAEMSRGPFRTHRPRATDSVHPRLDGISTLAKHAALTQALAPRVGRRSSTSLPQRLVPIGMRGPSAARRTGRLSALARADQGRLLEFPRRRPGTFELQYCRPWDVSPEQLTRALARHAASGTDAGLIEGTR